MYVFYKCHFVCRFIRLQSSKKIEIYPLLVIHIVRTTMTETTHCPNHKRPYWLRYDENDKSSPITVAFGNLCYDTYNNTFTEDNYASHVGNYGNFKTILMKPDDVRIDSLETNNEITIIWNKDNLYFEILITLDKIEQTKDDKICDAWCVLNEKPELIESANSTVQPNANPFLNLITTTGTPAYSFKFGKYFEIFNSTETAVNTIELCESLIRPLYAINNKYTFKYLNEHFALNNYVIDFTLLAKTPAQLEIIADLNKLFNKLAFEKFCETHK